MAAAALDIAELSFSDLVVLLSPETPVNDGRSAALWTPSRPSSAEVDRGCWPSPECRAWAPSAGDSSPWPDASPSWTTRPAPNSSRSTDWAATFL